MFCASLRKRPEWSSIPTILLSLKNHKWQEKRIETHDIALPIPNPNEPTQQKFLRLLLLSGSDLITNKDGTMARIERLQLQGEDKTIGVVFLLHEKNDESVNGAMAFTDLQLNIQNILLIPLHSLSALTNTIYTLHRSVTTSQLPRSKPPGQPLMTLLPYCTSRPSLPQSSLNVLSDICHSIPAVAQAATTDDGRAMLRDICPLGEEQVVEDMVEFWGMEIIAD